MIERIEKYINSYVSFEQPGIALPIALWIVGTHCFEMFDSFAYMVITSKTKRSGKTRLSEIISFTASSPVNFSSMTPSTLFRVINPDPKKYYSTRFIPPTIVFDEAESLSSEAAGTMRSVLNAGYRKGQSVPRTIGQEVVQFKVYCPKVFILIGDVYDTLRDRSIIISMVRGEPEKRFLYDEAQREGHILRTELLGILSNGRKLVAEHYVNERASFLSDREEEIWQPLFALCNMLCPARYRELTRIAVDLSAIKTSDRTAYKNLDMFETASEQAEYAEKAALDLLAIINGDKAISSAEAIVKLRDLDLSPWRTYRGTGIDQHMLGDLLATIGIPSVNIRFGAKVLKGYRKLDVETITKSLR